MKPNIGVSICLERIFRLPTVFFQFQKDSFGFYFLIDTSTRKNLIDPCFFKDWIDYTPSPATSDDPNSGLAFYPSPPPPAHVKLEAKKVLCKDGFKRTCDVVKLDFSIEGKEYSEIFILDPSLCRYFYPKKSKSIAGVLGSDFLRKHKWNLDFGQISKFG